MYTDCFSLSSDYNRSDSFDPLERLDDDWRHVETVRDTVTCMSQPQVIGVGGVGEGERMRWRETEGGRERMRERERGREGENERERGRERENERERGREGEREGEGGREREREIACVCYVVMLFSPADAELSPSP